MKELEEKCVCVCMYVCVCVCEILLQTWKNLTEAFLLLNQAYGEDFMSQTQCYEWFKHFKEGKMSFGEDPRPG